MAKYVCSICGYVYDEAIGDPGSGIPAGTAWEDLPEDWVCPLCNASISEFEKQGQSVEGTEKKQISVIEVSADIKELTPLEMSALCTNLARGCEKQYKAEEAALFTELGDYFKKGTASVENPNFDSLLNLIEKELQEGMPNAKSVASDKNDRGALRALTWCEKVTRMLNSILKRYEKEGDAMLENTGVYVCTICGYIYIGDRLPDVCPICKVPNWKFEMVEGR